MPRSDAAVGIHDREPLVSAMRRRVDPPGCTILRSLRAVLASNVHPVFGLRALLDELEARAALSWPSRVVPAPAVRQIALDGDRAALAALTPSRPLGPREIPAARALLLGDRRAEHEVDPEPIDVEVLLALAPAEAFQLRQLLAVRPALARGTEDAWLRVDQAILARQGLEAASAVATRAGSAIFVRDASLVPSMVAATRSAARAQAFAWLSRHADLSAGWAVRAALDASQRPLGAALLAYLFFEGQAAAVDATLLRMGAPELRAIFDRPYVPGLSYLPRVPPEGWGAEVPELPGVSSADRARIVSALAASALGENALVPALRAELPSRALSDFALGLLSAWRAARGTALSWVPSRAAELGDGRVARALGSAHRSALSKRDPRALELLDALALSTSELAIFELGRAAEGESASARARARQLLSPLAEPLSVDAFIERTVPSLELDARGERPIEDLEGWSLVVTSSLGVAVRDPSGALVGALPRGKKGALQKSAASELEAEVRAVAARAGKRLERAMCDARPLSGAMVEAMITHPVLLRVAQGVVWQDEAGLRFRIAEDGTAATIEDEARPLPSGAFRVAHPVSMTPEERTAWRELLASYELMPPFLQLDRRVHVPTSAERAQQVLSSRFFATRVHTLMGRGFALDWGADQLEKALPDGHTVFVELAPRFDPRMSAREQGELDALVTVRRGEARRAFSVLEDAVLSELWDLMPPRP